MTTIFNLCKKLIELGRTDGLQIKLDVYLANDRLTTDEYTALCEMLTAATAA